MCAGHAENPGRNAAPGPTHKSQHHPNGVISPGQPTPTHFRWCRVRKCKEIQQNLRCREGWADPCRPAQPPSAPNLAPPSHPATQPPAHQRPSLHPRTHPSALAHAHAPIQATRTTKTLPHLEPPAGTRSQGRCRSHTHPPSAAAQPGPCQAAPCAAGCDGRSAAKRHMRVNAAIDLPQGSITSPTASSRPEVQRASGGAHLNQ